jgi:hypothetical protein
MLLVVHNVALVDTSLDRLHETLQTIQPQHLFDSVWRQVIAEPAAVLVAIDCRDDQITIFISTVFDSRIDFISIILISVRVDVFIGRLGAIALSPSRIVRLGRKH